MFANHKTDPLFRLKWGHAPAHCQVPNFYSDSLTKRNQMKEIKERIGLKKEMPIRCNNCLSMPFSLHNQSVIEFTISLLLLSRSRYCVTSWKTHSNVFSHRCCSFKVISNSSCGVAWYNSAIHSKTNKKIKRKKRIEKKKKRNSINLNSNSMFNSLSSFYFSSLFSGGFFWRAESLESAPWLLGRRFLFLAEHHFHSRKNVTQYKNIARMI